MASNELHPYLGGSLQSTARGTTWTPAKTIDEKSLHRLDTEQQLQQPTQQVRGQVHEPTCMKHEDVREFLGAWQQDLQKQLQKHQDATSQVVIGIQDSMREQLLTSLKPLQEVLGELRARNVQDHLRQEEGVKLEKQQRTQEFPDPASSHIGQQCEMQPQCTPRQRWLRAGALIKQHKSGNQDDDEAEGDNVVASIAKKVADEVHDRIQQHHQQQHQQLQFQLQQDEIFQRLRHEHEHDEMWQRQQRQQVEKAHLAEQQKQMQNIQTESSQLDSSHFTDMWTNSSAKNVKALKSVDHASVEALKIALGLKVDRASVEAEDERRIRHQSIMLIIDTVSLFLTLANIILIGIETDIGLTNALAKLPQPNWAYNAETVFAVLFGVEVCVRICFERMEYVRGNHVRWNLFDCFLAICSLLDILAGILHIPIVASWRLLRVARAVRILKVISFVRELRIIQAAVIASMHSLAWSLAVLFFIIYLFSLFILQGVQIYMLEIPADTVVSEDLQLYWGGVSRAILSVIMAVTGGADWGDVSAPLFECHRFYLVAFVVFIAFFLFGILNILTAVFVEAATRIGDVDRDLVTQQKLVEHAATIDRIREVFLEVDIDKSGTITQHEMDHLFRQPKTIAHFEMLGLRVHEVMSLFTLLDLEGRKEVGIEELLSNVMRMKGAATGIDMATMMYESKRIYTSLSADFRHLENQLVRFASLVGINGHLTNGDINGELTNGWADSARKSVESEESVTETI